jgi:hypothetical protein
VNRIRGIVMVLAAGVAIWKGWQIHRGETAVLAYGLGAIAFSLGVAPDAQRKDSFRRQADSRAPRQRRRQIRPVTRHNFEEERPQTCPPCTTAFRAAISIGWPR